MISWDHPPNLEPYKQVPRCAPTPENTRRTHGGAIGDDYGKTPEKVRILYIYILYIYNHDTYMVYHGWSLENRRTCASDEFMGISWGFHGDPLGGELKSS